LQANLWDAIQDQAHSAEARFVSLFSRLRAVVSGDDYLDGDYDDELDYDSGEGFDPSSSAGRSSSALAISPDFAVPSDDPFAGTNVIGLPGLTNAVAEVMLMEPRSFDEMPRAIQGLRERKTVILNLTMMEPDQAQRAVDFVAGGTYAIDGHQERVGESIFLFAPSCVTVTASSVEEAASPRVSSAQRSVPSESQDAAPSPAWGRSDLLG
jgi:cell division inhibitor SepF